MRTAPVRRSLGTVALAAAVGAVATPVRADGPTTVADYVAKISQADPGSKLKDFDTEINLFVQQAAVLSAIEAYFTLQGASKRFRGTWRPTLFCQNGTFEMPTVSARSGRGDTKDVIAFSMQLDPAACVPPLGVLLELDLKGGNLESFVDGDGPFVLGCTDVVILAVPSRRFGECADGSCCSTLLEDIELSLDQAGGARESLRATADRRTVREAPIP